MYWMQVLTSKVLFLFGRTRARTACLQMCSKRQQYHRIRVIVAQARIRYTGDHPFISFIKGRRKISNSAGINIIQLSIPMIFCFIFVAFFFSYIQLLSGSLVTSACMPQVPGPVDSIIVEGQ